MDGLNQGVSPLLYEYDHQVLQSLCAQTCMLVTSYVVLYVREIFVITLEDALN